MSEVSEKLKKEISNLFVYFDEEAAEVGNPETVYRFMEELRKRFEERSVALISVCLQDVTETINQDAGNKLRNVREKLLQNPDYAHILENPADSVESLLIEVVNYESEKKDSRKNLNTALRVIEEKLHEQELKDAQKIIQEDGLY